MGNSNNNGKIVGALLLGAAVGGLIGILFAPDKGSETRKKISSKGNELTDSVKEKFGEFVDKFKKDIETVKDGANDFVENGKSVVKNLSKS
jgi:gas vesicle protein